jgi:hypothetical protein
VVYLNKSKPAHAQRRRDGYKPVDKRRDGMAQNCFEKPMAGAGNAGLAADLAAIALAKGGSIAEFRMTGEVG